MIELTTVGRTELDPVMALVRDAIHDMEKEGIHQWDEVYPDRTILADDIDKGQLFCVSSDETIAGIIALDEIQPSEYRNIHWNETGHYLIVHRLCIEPRFQGKGLAKLLMQFAEKHAEKHGHNSIRLDAFAGNRRALGLYDSLHYQRKGIVKFRKGEFYCYEKALTRQPETATEESL